MKWDIRDWFRYNTPYQVRETIWAIRAFFNPRQKWLTRKIPNNWIDKDRLLEICILEAIKHYVEGEDVFNVLSNDSPPEQAQFMREVRHAYDLIVKQLPLLEKELELAWKKVPVRDWGDINKSVPGDYETTYGDVDRLEKKIAELKTEVMLWAVKERESMWT